MNAATCDRQTAETWEQLPQSSRNVLFQIARKLSTGFTGEMRLSCAQGGVRRVEVTEALDTTDLGL